MFFLDKTGLLSIVALFVQCGTAAIFGMFLAVLGTRGGPWLRAFAGAFLALGGGLAALVLRFAFAQDAATGEWISAEGSWFVRTLYGLYMAGKLAFVWFVLAGVAHLRERRWPSAGRWLPWLAGIGVACGAFAPTIECLLLAQGLVVPPVFLVAAHWLSRGAGERGLGERVVAGTLRVWALLWVLYGTAVVAVGPLDPTRNTAWSHVLRLNSLVDLATQVVLGIGLVVLVMSEAQRLIVATLQERDELREQVRRAEKVRALSTLVGGVAHEINNPLTAIMGFAGDLRDDDPVARERAARIVLEQAERCRGIVQRMSLLGRSTAPVQVSFEVAALVQRVVDGFAPQCRAAGLAIDVHFGGAIAPFVGDPVGIEQVLANLIGNAIQASPSGARVAVRVADTAAASLSIDVLDHGPGVPAEDRVRVFEPFWTTKEVGVGTGLGLAVVDAIVRAHGGTVAVGDAPGGGARFTIELPRARSGVVGAMPTPAAPVAAASRPGDPLLRLLVIDDDPTVRAALARAAAARGWRVTEADGGVAALERLAAPDAAYDALVCDLRMPGLSGIDVHDALLARGDRWLRRIVFVTGA